MDIYTFGRFVLFISIVKAYMKCPPEAYTCEQCCCYTDPLNATFCVGNHISQIPRFDKLAISSAHMYIESTGIYSLLNLHKYYNLILLSVKNSLIACPAARIYQKNNNNVNVETDCPEILTTPETKLTTLAPINTSNKNTVYITNENTTPENQIQSAVSIFKTSTAYQVETVSVEPEQQSTIPVTQLMSSLPVTQPISTLSVTQPISTSSKETSSDVSDLPFDPSVDPYPSTSTPDPSTPDPSTENTNGMTEAYTDDSKSNRTNQIILLIVVIIICSVGILIVTTFSIIKCRRTRSYNINRSNNRPPSANAVYNPHILTYQNIPPPQSIRAEQNRYEEEETSVYEEVELDTVKVKNICVYLPEKQYCLDVVTV